MMIRLVVNCVVKLGLPLQCIDQKILWWWVMGAIISRCGDLVEGFCGAGV